jgi:hypothetical protein
MNIDDKLVEWFGAGVEGWSLEIEHHGSVCWHKDGVHFYLTPFWEGHEDGEFIPFEMCDLLDDGELIQFSFPFVTDKNDLEMIEKRYRIVLNQAIKIVEGLNK